MIWITKWAWVCAGLFLVYFLWAFSRWTNKRNVLKDNVRYVKRCRRNRLWILRTMPLEEEEREEGRAFTYEKLMSDTEDLLQ